MNIDNILNKYIDKNYLEFHKKICNTKYKILGIKIPILKKIAKDLLKEYDYKELLNNIDSNIYEHIMLEGLIIAYAKITYEERLELINNYIIKIDNWAICDIFCSSLKFINKNIDIFFEYIEKNIKDAKDEYIIRFYIVCLLDYYINDEYIDKVFKILLNIKSDYYYVKMAISWTYSICFIKYFDKTKDIFNKNNIDKWIYNKSIQKALESYRVNNINKIILKNMKRL